MVDTDDHSAIPEPILSGSVPDFDYSELNKGDRIGTGGEANVYEASLNVGDTTYKLAVKEPRFDGTVQTEVFEKFEQEAETWANLDEHQNIVSVYGYGSESIPWIALEYMDGGTLGDRSDDIDFEEGLWLAGRIAEGIRHGHRHGIAHLDLKPSNILLRQTPDDKWAYPKVGDWGLAKLLLEHSKSIEALSPRYAAPEQFDAEEYGRPDDITDIYQFGAIVYDLLTGQPPFTGSATDVMQSVLHKDPSTPSDVNPNLPTAVDQVLMKSISKEKSDRYESMLNLRRKIDRLFYTHATDRDPEQATAKPIQPTTGEKNEIVEGNDINTSNELNDQVDPGSLLSRRNMLAALGVIGAGGIAVVQTTTDLGVGSQTPEDGAEGSNAGGGTEGKTAALTASWSSDLLWGVFATADEFIGDRATREGGKVKFLNTEGDVTYLTDSIGSSYRLNLNQGNAVAWNSELLFASGLPGSDDTNCRLAAFSMEGESGDRRWNHHIGVNGNDTRIEHVAAGVNRVYHTVEGEGSATEQQPLVQAINNDDGTVGWQKEFEDTFFRGIALHESRVVVGTSQSLYLLDAATGDTIKELKLGTSAFGGLAKIEDTVYIADSEIKAYEVETGEQLWSETIGREPDSKILAQDDRLYAGTDAGFVVARSLTDGSKLWEANAGQSIETRPAVSNNIVWVGDATGNITGIDKETGASVYDNKLLQSSERMSIAALDSTLLVSGLYTDDSFALAHNINY